MSRLSANTLFHFTPREFLLEKFETGFTPRYNMEFDPTLDGQFFNKHAHITHLDLKTREETIKQLSHHPMHIPMVCFCDIPLSSLISHIDVYSSYGIGLKKEWGERSHLNPVMYVNEDSNFFNMLSGMFVSTDFISLMSEQEINNELKTIHDSGHKTEAIVEMLRFYAYQYNIVRERVTTHLKPRICKGKYRGKHENYSYYDEKEWRYVPAGDKDIPAIINDSLTRSQLEKLNKLQKRNAITFTADMVKYIIVNNKNDIEFVVDGLSDIKRRKRIYTDEDIHNLTTRIITREQIVEDF